MVLYDAAIGYDDSVTTYDGVTLAQLGVGDLRVELLLRPGSATYRQWSNETAHVRTEPGIVLSRGRTSESGFAAPSACALTFDNRAGRYAPRYAAGALYGNLLVRNQPLRVGLGVPVQGGVDTGTGTSVQAPDVPWDGASTGGAAWTVYSSGVTNVTLPVTFSNEVETDYASFTQSRGRGTDSASPLTSAAGSLSGSNAWAVAQYFVPGGTYSTSNDAAGLAGADTSSVDFSTSQADMVAVAVCWWSADVNGRMQPPTFAAQLTPPEMYLVADSGPSSGPRIAVWAWRQDAAQAGEVYLKGANDAATNAGISVAWWSGAAAYSPRFCGEVADWPQAFTKDGAERWASVRAGGALRRVAANQDVVSPLLGAFRGTSKMLAYWPMEEPPGATVWSPVIGTALQTPVGSPDPGAVSGVAGSLSLPSFAEQGSSGAVSGADAVSWGFGGVVQFPTDPLGAWPLFFAGSSAGLSMGLYSFGDSTLSLFIGSSVTTGPHSPTTAFPNGLLGKQAMFYVTGTQNGANVDWALYCYNITPGEPTAVQVFSGSTAGTLGRITSLSMGVDTLSGDLADAGAGLGMGHAFVTTGTVLPNATFRASAGRGYAQSDASLAAGYICADNGVQLAVTTNVAVDTLNAGPVGNQPLLQTLNALETGVQALMSDAAGFVGLEWRPAPGLESQTSSASLSYDAGTFTGDLRPNDDDETTVNDAQVSGLGGGYGRSVVVTGALGAQPGGVGRYARTFEAATENSTTAQYLADWLTHVGTHDAARWPEVTVEMSAPGALAIDLDTLSIGDWVSLEDMPALTGPATVDLIVIGVREEFDSALYRLTLLCRLADPWNVVVPELSATYDTIGDDTDPDLYPPVYLGI